MADQNVSVFVTPQFRRIKRVNHPFERHIEQLRRLSRACWDGTTAEEFAGSIAAGYADLYEVIGGGLMVLQTVIHPRGRELMVCGMVGRGIVNAEVLDDLIKLARYTGCSMIGGNGVPRAWRRMCPKLGFRPVETHYVMELDHG